MQSRQFFSEGCMHRACIVPIKPSGLLRGIDEFVYLFTQGFNALDPLILDGGVGHTICLLGTTRTTSAKVPDNQCICTGKRLKREGLMKT
ncbi:hypothetical protein SAMN05720354_101146 [Nitrosospira sp. Nsp1]|nr:hypothetical protein SAMN05720354_101146 [Nitrosospira sp. Nsp1]